MEAALAPLRMACEVVMGRDGQRALCGGGCGAEEGAQMAKRVRMLTYLLHRSGHVQQALAWAAAAVGMLVRVRDMRGAARALEEYYTLAGSGEGEGGAEEAGGVMLSVVEGVDAAVAVEALLLELQVGVSARVPPLQV